MSSTASAKASKNEQQLQKALELQYSRQFPEAEKIIKKIIKTDPKNEAALLSLAEMQFDTGRHDVALNTLAKLVKVNPQHPKGWRHIGYIELFAKADMNRALHALTKALEINQTDPEVYYLMGYLSQNMNQFEDAIELYEIGLQLDPTHAEMMSFAGSAYLRQRHFDRAKELVIKALQLKPDNPNILMNALKADEMLTFDDAQKAVLEKILDKHRHSKSMKDQILLHDAKIALAAEKYDEALEKLKMIDDSKTLISQLKYQEIGNIYRKSGDYDRSFENYKKANDIQANSPTSKKYKKSTLLAVIQQEIDILNEDFVEKVKIRAFQNDVKGPYKSPIFLTGFPRSGTTLSGRILDSHPKLITADEYGSIDQAKLHFHQKFPKRLPFCLPDLTPEEVMYFREMYNEKQGGLPMKHSDKIFIDKLPLNSINASTIYGMFPDSKILFIWRHPLDSILSGFMQLFAVNAGMVHFNDIEDMARLFLKMHETWKLQKQYLPIDYLEFKYEDMVENFDDEIGKILDFIGVEWDDNVRNFNQEDENAAGPKTLTPSRTQINKTLYKGAQNRWKKYEKHLKPAIDILGDTIEELGYEL